MSSYALMTNVGRAKEAAALANGTSISITEIAWGDGDRSPGGGEATLLNELGRKPVQHNGVLQDALNTAFFEILLDANEGPFLIHEAGLFDVDGDLIAVAKYDPPVNKPKDTVSALLRIAVVFSDLENLVLNVQSTDAYVPANRMLTAGTGLAGGGDLSADRSFAVVFASQAQALAGAAEDVVMNPLRVAEAIAQAIDALVAGAPGALDTLNEIAAALQDNDSDLSAIFVALGTKLDAAAYTAADVLAKLLPIDGAGSGLDADFLDGQHGAFFLDLLNATGVIPDGRLPTRISPAAYNLGGHPAGHDWNNATHNGWYQAIDAANAPNPGIWYIGEVISHEGLNWVTQTVHSFTAATPADTTSYRRHKQAGGWSAWYRLRFSEAEIQHLITISPTGFGAGQTWQDFLGSRTVDTTYQNTTGRPIMVSITTTYSGGGFLSSFEVSTDAVNWQSLALQTGDRSHPNSGQFIVPNGYYYRVPTGPSINRWSELR